MREGPIKPIHASVCFALLMSAAITSGTALAAVGHAPAALRAAATASAVTCVGSVGPGIPAPAQVANGIPGYHSAWYGQSGYTRMCAYQVQTFTVAFLNSGSLGWYGGKMGQSAYLGTWGPDPGQDKPSPLGGNGQLGSPNTHWPAYDRLATQPVPYVGPGQVAWFRFTLQAPTNPGWYRLDLRPLIEGNQWLEDEGIHWQIVVLNSDGSVPPQPVQAASTTGTAVLASWFGPGLYGNGTACGETLTSALLGVADRTLPCGTPVTLQYGSSRITVPVVDRGPWVYSREFDLTYATRLALGCPDVCSVLWIR